MALAACVAAQVPQPNFTDKDDKMCRTVVTELYELTKGIWESN